MGYDIFVLRTDVRIARENHDTALEAIKRLDPHAYYGARGFANQNFAFVDGMKYREAETLDEVLWQWRWSTDYDDEGNLILLGLKAKNWATRLSCLKPSPPSYKMTAVSQRQATTGGFGDGFSKTGAFGSKRARLFFQPCHNRFYLPALSK